MGLNLGLNVVEVDGRVAPSIQPAPTSVCGFIVKAQRGVPGRVIQITNLSQFQEHFGAPIDGAYGAYAVQGFFLNGGSVAQITRVVNTIPTTATAAMLETNNEGPWALSPGAKLVFKTDRAAAPIDVVFNASEARLSGGSGPFDLSDGTAGKKLGLTVNGIERGPIEFAAADFANGLNAATALEVAAVLNREFPGIQALVDNGNLIVRTDRRGTGATLAAKENAAAVLGLAASPPVLDNVFDIDAVTPEEAASIFSAALSPSGLLVAQDGKKVVIRHPETGTTKTIQIDATSADVAAVASIFGLKTNPQTGTNGDPSAAAAPAGASFGSALTVKAGYRGKEDPGAWGEQLSVTVAQNVNDPTLFDLTVLRNGAPVETFPQLSMESTKPRFVEKVVNDEFAGSKFVTVKATGTANPTPGTAPLTNGNDGKFADMAAEVGGYNAAVSLYELVDIQLLACPETSEDAFVKTALAHCAMMGDRMFVGHCPQALDADAAKAYGKNYQGDKVYGALYFPWIRVADPQGGTRWIPPTGHILGMFARTELERGIWKAPAGNRADLRGALDIAFHITDVIHTDLVKNGSVNAVRDIPGLGIVVDSSRSLSTSPLWLYINIRLLFNFVKSSLKYGLRWVVQEPNTTKLWNDVKFNSVTPFLMGLWRRGAFGPGAPEEVFTVKIDAENNPSANIQQGILTCEIYFYPSRPAETIVLIIGQQEGAASATEA